MMEQFKGTKGPWIYYENYTQVGLDTSRHQENGRFIIAETYGTDSNKNGFLIAAAPELLEALNTISNWLACHPITTNDDMAQSFEQMQEIAEKAINKALNINQS